MRIPRVSVHANFDEDMSIGEVNTASLGYGIHQAWIYSTLFGTSGLFGISSNIPSMTTSSVFLASIIVNVATLLAFGCFDMKVTRLSVRRYPLVAPMLAVVLGTLLVFFCDADAPYVLSLVIVSGILTGIGSAVFLVYWGIAFARMSLVSIIMNTIISYAVAALLYSLLSLIGAPYGGVIACLLPALEAALVGKHAPKPYAETRGVPFFNYLPVRRLKFGLVFCAPMLFFGVALGYMRTESMSGTLTSPDSGLDMLQVGMAVVAAVIVLVAGMSLLRSERVEDFLRPVVPVVGIAIALIPLYEFMPLARIGLFVFAGYICFAAILWITLAAFSQRYRLSPVFVFGLGRGSLSLGAIAGIAISALLERSDVLFPYSDGGFVVVALLCVIAGQALLPRQRDVRRVVLANSDGADSLADTLNLKQNDPKIEGVKRMAETQDTAQQQVDLEADEGNDVSGADAAADGHEPVEEKDDCCPETAEPPDESAEDECESAGGSVAEKKEDVVEEPSKREAPRKLSLMEQVAEEQKKRKELTDEQRVGFFRRKCEAVANQYLLSARETEVLFYLAKGYNSAYLQEKLYISEGTAKTHIRHIYGKTNVHSQQELMRLVNETYVDYVD